MLRSAWWAEPGSGPAVVQGEGGPGGRRLGGGGGRPGGRRLGGGGASEPDAAEKGSRRRKLGSTWKESLVEDTATLNTNSSFSESTVFTSSGVENQKPS